MDSLLELLRHPLVIGFIAIVVILVGHATLFALITLLERKGLGRMQNRPGPNRVGPFGILQPAADGIKMLIKEDIVPEGADRVVHYLAPIVLFAPLTLGLAVIPYGPKLVAVNLDAALLFFFAIGSCAELAAFMAGWASRNKYSLLGAMRAIAQMISFELPLVLSTLVVVMMTGSLSLARIVEAQSGWHFGLPAWNVFTPWGLLGFLLFVIAALAETNRSPFDLPEGESEIIGGFMTEYSGFKYAIFFMGEYFGMFAICGLGISLFLGGWGAPVSFLDWVPGLFWYLGKLLAMVFFFIWLRGTLPRLRADQLMNLCWKFLLPLALFNLLVAVFWHWSSGWEFAGSLIGRWLLGMGLVVGTFVGASMGMMSRRLWRPRTYHFAE